MVNGHDVISRGVCGTVAWDVEDGGDTLRLVPVNGDAGAFSCDEAYWRGWNVPAMRVRRVVCEGAIRVRGSLECMFSGYERLEDVSGLSHWDVSGVESLCQCFLGCTSLPSLRGLEAWDVRGVRDVMGAFGRCDALTDVSALSGWDVSRLGSLDYMFDHCTRLADLTPLSSWDVSGVETMRFTFCDCVGIEALDGLDRWDTRSLTDITSCFLNCRSLEDASAVGGWDTHALRLMDLAFEGCESLAELDLSGWDARSIRQASGAFRGCERLKTLDLSGWDARRLCGKCGGIFDWCASLDDVRLGPDAGKTLPAQVKTLNRWRNDRRKYGGVNPADMIEPPDKRRLRMSDEEIDDELQEELLREMYGDDHGDGSDDGTLKATVASADSSMTDGNDAYTLSGTTLRVWSDEAMAKLAATTVAGADGHADDLRLKPGDYWVTVASTPDSYVVPTKATKVTVQGSKDVEVTIRLEPVTAEVGEAVRLVDADTLEDWPQGDARLEDAHATITGAAGKVSGLAPGDTHSERLDSGETAERHGHDREHQIIFCTCSKI